MWRHAKEYRKDHSASMNENNFAYIRMCAYVIVRMGMYICAQGVAPQEGSHCVIDEWNNLRLHTYVCICVLVYVRMCVYVYIYMIRVWRLVKGYRKDHSAWIIRNNYCCI